MTSFYGKFVWYELMTTDAKAAETFYRSVVGWGAKEAGLRAMPIRSSRSARCPRPA